MFTARQMTYLCHVQWQDDWHCSYFVTVVKEYHTSPSNDFVKEARLEQAEFEGLIAILSRADQESIFNLQMALNCLNLLPCSMFKQPVDQEYSEAISCTVSAVEGDPRLEDLL